jgi:ubiquitin carboxyl-terminal hydrolase 25/28
MEAGTHEPTLNIDEAYKRLQVSSHVPDETVLLLYKSLFDDAPSGSKDSFTDALRVIATTRNSDWLRSKIGNPNGPDPVLKGNADQPVGLENIGNTCYLNSLLQYYYTVKSVRDVVMNFDEYRMPLNTETLLNKRVGGRAVDRSEVVKAQKCRLLLQQV